MAELSDGDLLHLFVAKQDENAFALLVQRHGAMVMGVCRRVLQHQQDSEDAFQATFLVLSRKARSISRRESLSSWLYKVAYRIALRARTTLAKRKGQERESFVALQTSSEESATDLGWLVDEEVRRLPEKYRAPVLLCYLQGQTNEEAARSLDCPTGTVKIRLSRARDMLRKRLQRRGMAVALVVCLTKWTEDTLASSPTNQFIANTAEICFDGLKGAIPAHCSGHAVTLMRGWLKSMAMAKMKIACAILLIVGLIFFTDRFAQQARSSDQTFIKSHRNTRPINPSQPLPDPRPTEYFDENGIFVFLERKYAMNPLTITAFPHQVRELAAFPRGH